PETTSSRFFVLIGVCRSARISPVLPQPLYTPHPMLLWLGHLHPACVIPDPFCSCRPNLRNPFPVLIPIPRCLYPTPVGPEYRPAHLLYQLASRRLRFAIW